MKVAVIVIALLYVGAAVATPAGAFWAALRIALFACLVISAAVWLIRNARGRGWEERR